MQFCALPGAPAPPFSSPKTEQLARLMAERHGRPIRRLLVVGCGSGREAAVLAQQLDCDVVGIDLNDRFDPAAARAVTLEQGDATALRFADRAFDYVYSYHVLEHIPDYRRALAEMRRVLAPEGGWCIGTPNRARLVGYLGSRTSWQHKLAWNAADWRMRLRGRFRNEYGAHAGFTSKELRAALAAVFSTPLEITNDYYDAVYRRRARLLRVIERSGLGPLLLPSVYFVGRR